MTRRDFSGREIVKVLTKHRYRIVGRSGSHVQLRYEHPDNDDDVRVVTVPLHDQISIGTLHSIADQCEADSFDEWCSWIEKNC